MGDRFGEDATCVFAVGRDDCKGPVDIGNIACKSERRANGPYRDSGSQTLRQSVDGETRLRDLREAPPGCFRPKSERDLRHAPIAEASF